MEAIADNVSKEWDRTLGNLGHNLAGRLQPLALADLPTPVERLAGVGEMTGNASLFIKRDDLSSRLYGGNKVRKLEFLLGKARREGSRTLVTVGGIGSNHLLATALHARAKGMRTVGVVFPQPENENVRRNLAADRAAGVELVQIPSKYSLPLYVAVTLARLRIEEGRLPELIPGGGSSPLGALGFVNAGLELGEQVRAGELPEPEAVFLPYGTGGTVTGLALGLGLGGLGTRVVAVRVIDALIANRPRMMLLVRRICGLLKSLGVAIPARAGRNIEMLHTYFGPGYGHPTPEAERARDTFEREDEIALELTYTAKAAAAFLDRARAGGGPLLFWNTYSSADIGDWVAAGESMA